jgi:hypothetical protein
VSKKKKGDDLISSVETNTAMRDDNILRGFLCVACLLILKKKPFIKKRRVKVKKRKKCHRKRVLFCFSVSVDDGYAERDIETVGRRPFLFWMQKEY